MDTIAGDHAIFSFGATHSFILTQELVYRTGGLMLVNPIYPYGMDLSVRVFGGSGITVAVPTSSRRRASTGSAWM